MAEILEACLARVKGIAHGFTDKGQQREHEREGGKGGQAQPWGLQVVFALREELPQRRRARRQAQPQKIERGQRGDGPRQDKGHIGNRRHHRVWQDMPPHDDGV